MPKLTKLQRWERRQQRGMTKQQIEEQLARAREHFKNCGVMVVWSKDSKGKRVGRLVSRRTKRGRKKHGPAN